MAPDFWNDGPRAQQVQKKLGQMQDIIKSWEDTWSEIEEAELLLELAVEEKDGDAEREVAEGLETIGRDIALTE